MNNMENLLSFGQYLPSICSIIYIILTHLTRNTQMLQQIESAKQILSESMEAANGTHKQCKISIVIILNF